MKSKKKRPWRLHVKKGALQAIKEKRKRMLVRLDDNTFANHYEGDEVIICSADYACTCMVTRIRKYESLEHLLANENLERLNHGDRAEAEHYLADLFGHIPADKRLIAMDIVLIRRGRNVPKARHNK